MRTLASELGPIVERDSGRPRVYVDANMPAGLVAFMRTRLRWDVLFVVEHEELRRAHDGEHFRLARQLRRTLLTLDRDYSDDRRFPPAESGGVIVMAAPDERALRKLLVRLDRGVFRACRRPSPPAAGQPAPGLPLIGRKLRADVDWEPPSTG